VARQHLIGAAFAQADDAAAQDVTEDDATEEPLRRQERRVPTGFVHEKIDFHEEEDADQDIGFSVTSTAHAPLSPEQKDLVEEEDIAAKPDDQIEEEAAPSAPPILEESPAAAEPIHEEAPAAAEPTLEEAPAAAEPILEEAPAAADVAAPAEEEGAQEKVTGDGEKAPEDEDRQEAVGEPESPTAPPATEPASGERRPSVTFDEDDAQRARSLERRPSFLRKPTPFERKRTQSLEDLAQGEIEVDDLACPHARFKDAPEAGNGERRPSWIRHPTPHPGKHPPHGHEGEAEKEAQRGSLSDRRPSWSGQPAPLKATRPTETSWDPDGAFEKEQEQKEEEARAAALEAARAAPSTQHKLDRWRKQPRSSVCVHEIYRADRAAAAPPPSPPAAATRSPAAASAASVRSADEGQLAIRNEAQPLLGKSSSLPMVGYGQRKGPSTHLKPKPKVKRRKLPPPQAIVAWDDRHQLCGVENELLPKSLRAYFSRPQSLPELREELKKKKKQMPSMLRKFEAPEKPALGASPITCDAEPTICPERHELGGVMKDKDNEVRSWNNRWSSSIGQLNDGMHPLHREYFSKPSLFATAPSQRWRRYIDTEVEHGVWKSNECKRPQLFPPLGA